jgi:hypothetical protein
MKIRKFYLVFAILTGFLLVGSPGPALCDDPPTLDEVKAATAAGVAWLAAQQNHNGSWGNYDYCSVTGLALKKLMHHAVDPKYGLGLESPFDESYAYKSHIEKGLNYLFTYCPQWIAIGVQPAGDPDSDGDGLGIWWGLSPHHSSYASGIILMMLCEAVELDRVIDVGPLAGQTYADAARDTMDLLIFGQNDAGWERGGWGYHHNDIGRSDNSNAGYVTLGLGFAEALPPAGCGFTLPNFLKAELNVWINYIQNPVDSDPEDGGSGYTHPGSWVNILKTGNLLQQMALYGDGPLTSRVQDAVNYMCRHWATANQDPGWLGNSSSSNYQATFTTMKGFQSLGIEQFCDPPIDWQVDFETELLAEQLADGSWINCHWGNPILCTTWALLTLQKAVPIATLKIPVDIKPGSCPNPLSCKSKGVIPVAIAGTDELDVTQIDPASLQLAGVSPLRWAYEDVATPFEPYTGKEDCKLDCHTHGADGYLDLTLKFENQEVLQALAAAGVSVDNGACLVIRLTGNLLDEYDGRAIEGEDVMLVRCK